MREGKEETRGEKRDYKEDMDNRMIYGLYNVWYVVSYY